LTIVADRKYCAFYIESYSGLYVSKLSFKGVVVGGVTDIVSTNILAIPLIVYILMSKTNLRNVPPHEAQSAITNALQSSSLLYASQLLIGSACSVLGGYVGARLAKHDELLNGLLTSFLCVGIGVYSLAERIGSSSSLLHLLGFVASPALGLLGGYLRLAQKRAQRTLIQPTQSTATS